MMMMASVARALAPSLLLLWAAPLPCGGVQFPPREAGAVPKGASSLASLLGRRDQPQSGLADGEAAEPSSEPDVQIQFPTEPGCYVRTPTGCPHHPEFSNGNASWKHAEHAERSTAVMKNRTACEVDWKLAVLAWCGALDVQVVYVSAPANASVNVSNERLSRPTATTEEAKVAHPAEGAQQEHEGGSDGSSGGASVWVESAGKDSNERDEDYLHTPVDAIVGDGKDHAAEARYQKPHEGRVSVWVENENSVVREMQEESENRSEAMENGTTRKEITEAKEGITTGKESAEVAGSATTGKESAEATESGTTAGREAVEERVEAAGNATGGKDHTERAENATNGASDDVEQVRRVVENEYLAPEQSGATGGVWVSNETANGAGGAAQSAEVPPVPPNSSKQEAAVWIDNETAGGGGAAAGRPPADAAEAAAPAGTGPAAAAPAEVAEVRQGEAAAAPAPPSDQQGGSAATAAAPAAVGGQDGAPAAADEARGGTGEEEEKGNPDYQKAIDADLEAAEAEAKQAASSPLDGAAEQGTSPGTGGAIEKDAEQPSAGQASVQDEEQNPLDPPLHNHTEAACFFRTPAGCPRQPGYGGKEWQQVSYADKSKVLPVDRSMCEVDWHAAVTAWCGAELVEMLFVPEGSWPAPSETGCFVRTPAGCPSHPDFSSAAGAAWQQDEIAERHTQSSPAARAECEVYRKAHLIQWCGTGDVEVVFVAPNATAAVVDSNSTLGAEENRPETVPEMLPRPAEEPPQVASSGVPAGRLEVPEQQSEAAEQPPQEVPPQSLEVPQQPQQPLEVPPEPQEVPVHRLEAPPQQLKPPMEPGCFVRTPSGCPNHPDFGNTSWQHDEYAERYTQAKEDREECELRRKVHLIQWCGAADVETLFMEYSTADKTAEHARKAREEVAAAVEPPAEPGCFVRLPAGCPQHPGFGGAAWKHDSHAERHLAAQTNRAECEVYRRAHLAQWCGTDAVEMLFLPYKYNRTGAAAGAAARSSLAGDEEGEEDEKEDEEDEEDPRLLAFPTEPGCFVRTLSGCPNHPSFSNSSWRHDDYAERYTTAQVERADCEVQRREHLTQWCGGAVEMLFLEYQTAEEADAGGAGAAGRRAVEAPREPGCFVRVPSGCPQHPGFGGVAWTHDEYAERYTSAQENRTECEVRRREFVVRWCGTADVEMAFVGYKEKKGAGGPSGLLAEGEELKPAPLASEPAAPPSDPGCYVRMPSGCPNHPSFGNSSWQHDEYTERYASVQGDRMECEVNRKGHLIQWCGVDDVEMLFVESNASSTRTGEGDEKLIGGVSVLQPTEADGDAPQQRPDLPAAVEGQPSMPVVDEAAEQVATPTRVPDTPERQIPLTPGYEVEQRPTWTTSDGAATQPSAAPVEPAAVERPPPVTSADEAVAPIRASDGVDGQSSSWTANEEAPHQQAAAPTTVADAASGQSPWTSNEANQAAAPTSVPDAATGQSPWTSNEMASHQQAPRQASALPTEPGCYVRLPSGCPYHPGFGSTSWEHDEYAERYSFAQEDRAACEVRRREDLLQWCGAAEVEMLFVGSQAADQRLRRAEVKSELQPAADEQSSQQAGDEARQQSSSQVQSGLQPAAEEQSSQQAGGETRQEASSQVKSGLQPATHEQSSQDADDDAPQQSGSQVPLPGEAGCFVRTPSGCPNHPSFGSMAWQHDEVGERYTRAREDRTECEVRRKQYLVQWCGANDVEVLFMESTELDGGAQRIQREVEVSKPARSPLEQVAEDSPASRTEEEDEEESRRRSRGAAAAAAAPRAAEDTEDEEEDQTASEPRSGRQEDATAPATIQSSSNHEPLPKEPGCFVRTPSGCPNHPDFGSVYWEHDGYAEGYTPAMEERSECEVHRRQYLQRWCGADDVEMLFVEDLKAPAELTGAAAAEEPPTEPGCFVRMPTGCPNHPSFGSLQWKHDEYAERYTFALQDRKECEVFGREHVVQWCGTQDVESLFIKGDAAGVSPHSQAQPEQASSPALVGVPTEPGCFVRMPSGCPSHPSFGSSSWFHDEYAERHTLDGEAKEECEVHRREHLAQWCGSDDVQAAFIEAPPPPPPQQRQAAASPPSAGAGAGGEQGSLRTGRGALTGGGGQAPEAGAEAPGAAAATAAAPPAVKEEEVQPLGIPMEPGCFIRTPQGCPRHPDFHSAEWRHASHAERTTTAKVNRTACEVAWRARVAQWCGTPDVDMLFVPTLEPQYRLAAPTEPGCYVRTPSGCPKRPGFASLVWKHDEHGEANSLAKEDRVQCEVLRKGSLAQWCGAEDVEMLFVGTVELTSRV